VKGNFDFPANESMYNILNTSSTQSAILTVNKEQLGFNNSHGPELFDELVSLMADDVLEISSASARRLYNSFAVGYTKHENMPEQLKPIPSLTSIPVSEEMARPNELIVSRVLIDPKSGVCPRSDVKLELIKLDDDQRKQFVDSIFRLSKSRFEEFKERINRNLKHDHGTKALTSFTSWLNSREGKPFTAIIGMYDLLLCVLFKILSKNCPILSIFCRWC
jgi:hypothetical protein